MAADETVRLKFLAEIGDLAKTLGTIPGITEKEAQRAVIALERQLKKTEVAGRTAAKASEKAAGLMKKANSDAFNDIKKGSEKVFGGIVGDVEDIGKGLMALGPAGAAAAVGMAAVAAVEVGLFKAAHAAFEMSVGLAAADKKLENLYQRGVPGFTRASEEALQASRELNASFVVLDQTSTQLSVTVGNEFAPAFNSASDDVVAFTLIANDATKALFDSTYAMEYIRTTAENVFPFTATLMDLWSHSTVEYREQAEKMIRTETDKARITEINAGLQKIAIEKTKELDKANQDAEEAERERTKELHKQEAAQRKAIAAAERRDQIERQLNDTLNGMFTEFLGPLEQIEEKYDTLGQKVAELGGSESDLGQVEMARHMAKMGYIDAETAKVEEAARRATDVRVKAEEEVAKEAKKSQEEVNDRIAAAFEKDTAAAKERAEQSKVAAQTSADLAFTLADDVLQAQIDAGKGGTAAQKKFALEAFNAQKAATTAQIVIDGIRATSAAAASAPFPANLAPIAATVLAYSALASKAASAKPPKFHTGGLPPDELLVRRNEVRPVITRQGFKDGIGGEHGLAKINRGESPGSGTTVVMQYQHKGSASYFDDNLRMSGSPLRRAMKGGRRVGHRGRG